MYEHAGHGAPLARGSPVHSCQPKTRAEPRLSPNVRRRHFNLQCLDIWADAVWIILVQDWADVLSIALSVGTQLRLSLLLSKVDYFWSSIYCCLRTVSIRHTFLDPRTSLNSCALLPSNWSYYWNLPLSTRPRARSSPWFQTRLPRPTRWSIRCCCRPTAAATAAMSTSTQPPSSNFNLLSVSAAERHRHMTPFPLMDHQATRSRGTNPRPSSRPSTLRPRRASSKSGRLLQSLFLLATSSARSSGTTWPSTRGARPRTSPAAPAAGIVRGRRRTGPTSPIMRSTSPSRTGTPSWASCSRRTWGPRPRPPTCPAGSGRRSRATARTGRRRRTRSARRASRPSLPSGTRASSCPGGRASRGCMWRAWRTRPRPRYVRGAIPPRLRRLRCCEIVELLLLLLVPVLGLWRDRTRDRDRHLWNSWRGFHVSGRLVRRKVHGVRPLRGLNPAALPRRLPPSVSRLFHGLYAPEDLIITITITMSLRLPITAPGAGVPKVCLYHETPHLVLARLGEELGVVPSAGWASSAPGPKSSGSRSASRPSGTGGWWRNRRGPRHSGSRSRPDTTGDRSSR